MATWLHDPAALLSLADGPEGAARDWANLRLALRGPDRMQHLPTRPWDRMIAIAIGARGAVDGVLELVRSGSPAAVEALDTVLALGAVPEDRAAWVAPVRALFDTVAEADRATVARALADLGALDAEVLGVTARADGPDARALLPGLVLRWASGRGMPLDAVAAEVAGPLVRAEREQPGLLGWAMTALGLPHLAVEGTDPAAAVLAGARIAGSERTFRPDTKGSVRSRTRRTVLGLLEGRTGPAEALLRALVAHEGLSPAPLASWAAWCACRPDGSDPVAAVVHGGAGEDRALLAAARRGLGDPSPLIRPLRDPMLASTPLVSLGAARVIGSDSDGLRDALLVRAELSREIDASAELGAFAAAASDPDRVVDWLSNPESRDLGLSCARFAPTVEVLSTLLDLHVPLDPGAREVWAWALAEMADPAAYAVLQATGGIGTEALTYAGELLGR